MTTAKATLVIRWEETNPKFALLHLIAFLEKEGLLQNVIEIVLEDE